MKKVLKILLVILLVLIILLIINSIRNYKILNRIFVAEENFLFDTKNFYLEIHGILKDGEQKYINEKIYYKDGILNKIFLWNKEDDDNTYCNILWQSELEKKIYKSFFSSEDAIQDREYQENNESALEDLKSELLELKLSSLGNLKLYIKTNILNFIKSEDNCYIISYINGKILYVNKDTGLIEKSTFKSKDKIATLSTVEYTYSENTVTDEDVTRIELNEFTINNN
jgi:hypothetical protein